MPSTGVGIGSSSPPSTTSSAHAPHSARPPQIVGHWYPARPAAAITGSPLRTSSVIPDGSTRTVAVTRSRGCAEEVTVEHLVEPSHARLLAPVPPQARAPGRAEPSLDPVEVLEVLLDDEAPLVGAPVGVHLAFRQRPRLGSLGLLLHRPQVEDARIWVESVRANSVPEERTRDHRADEVREHEEVVTAEHLLVGEVGPVEAARDGTVAPPVEVVLARAHAGGQLARLCAQRLGLARTDVPGQVVDEVVDLGEEDLLLVDVLGRDPEPGARHRPAPTAVPSVRVQWRVLERGVVLPFEDLGMHGRDVVALVERVDDDLPVGVDDRRLHRREDHALRSVRIEPVGDVLEVRAQWRRVGFEVHEDEAAVLADLYVTEPQLVGGGGRELVRILHVRVRAVEVPPPTVERAADLAPERTAAGCESRPAVDARVVEGAHVARGRAGHEGGVVSNRILHEVARIRNLLEPARDLPHARPQTLVLERDE